MKTAFAETTFNKWIKSVQNMETVCQQRTIEDLYDHFCNWADRAGEKVFGQANFNMRMREYISSVKLNYNVENASRLVKNTRISLSQQFNHLRSMVTIMTQGVINSLYVYGEPGIGKSELTLRSLQEAGADFIVFSGGVKGTAELARILYENRENKILVFDDFDSVFAKRAQIDILKIALQDKTRRTISWVDNTKRAKANKIPERFDFTSAVIFVSNRKKLDPAVKDRCAIVTFDSTKEENLEWIKSQFATFLPAIDMKMKNMIYDFIKKNIAKFDRVNFRVFRFAIVNYVAHPEDDTWKNITINSNTF